MAWVPKTFTQEYGQHNCQKDHSSEYLSHFQILTQVRCLVDLVVENTSRSVVKVVEVGACEHRMFDAVNTFLQQQLVINSQYV